ncbi:maleylpyruvate isomerase family mycothiol-dependent enzyme [Mycobacterium gordonae]|uniref:Mycothiol-dependent maleylpyruvate isomerase metal-binding domain-containing protein n=1 Tax=Mycobacterium gordonae TaxID=1778 RepID=A0A1A6B6K6_MYCGO|nr:maleylpyruvate isomerase family mycothiol-dependent enzyme [Mycobacterium gordonae]PJE15298.1 MAG: maleylpyruvate isomerase family mycothiol-dependent enzyme [Mycobacterium sp.]MCQ4362105.1 maleylpyruvate isomerase family mycothiol-dependent enzyme [Mycobacterium gordonae]MCV7004547.1 maleylpyruvate isomerase family mycothiol-dependent enzyme [Mycobacterium gordonae]OBR97974.1 hypothetical protein A9W98_04370 [Mycobacterium gordonae]ODR24132.1 hypothetical protein BHQ23_01785 [Mycobacterium
MSRDMLRTNDIRFVDVARSLTDAEWAQPSLCAEWSNHEVLAHLVLGYRMPPRELTVGMISHRGSFDRANAAAAADLARRHSPADLVNHYAALIHRPRGIGRVFPRRLLLGDHVIHELDIIFALGRHPGIGRETLAAVLDTQVRIPNPFVPAAARARGLKLQAGDADWSHGEGVRTVSGTAAHLASVLAGRPWALHHLSGDGVELLRARVCAP